MISDEFSGTMDGEGFWDDLRTFARNKNAFVILVY